MLLLLEISIKVLASRSVRGGTKPLHVTGDDDRTFALQSVIGWIECLDSSTPRTIMKISYS